MKSIFGSIFVKPFWLWSKRACQANLALVVALEFAQSPITHCFYVILSSHVASPGQKNVSRSSSCHSGNGSRTEHRIAGVASSTLFLLPHRKMTAVTARSVLWNSLLARQCEASLRTEKRMGAVCWPNRLSQNLSRSSAATTARSITVPRASIQTSSQLRLHRPPLLRAPVLIPHVLHPNPPPLAGLLSSSLVLHRVVVSHAQVCA